MFQLRGSNRLPSQPMSCRGQFLTSPLGQTLTPGAKLSARGEFYPRGSPGSEILCSPLHSYKQYRVGPSSLVEVKFTPGARGEVKNGPLASAL
jgi:hypothetical protein